MYKRLFILVEGNDDERFFRHAIQPLLEKEYNTITIYQYSQKPNNSINSFLVSIKAMEADYIFVGDIDSNECVAKKKRKILNKLNQLFDDKIVVVIKEIESWYLAGLNQESSNQMGISQFSDTNNVYKEQFNEIIPQRFSSRVDFFQEVLKYFSIDIARLKNESLNYFTSKFIDPINNIDLIREQSAVSTE